MTTEYNDYCTVLEAHLQALREVEQQLTILVQQQQDLALADKDLGLLIEISGIPFHITQHMTEHELYLVYELLACVVDMKRKERKQLIQAMTETLTSRRL